MKKTVALVMSLMLMLSVCGCSSNEEKVIIETVYVTEAPTEAVTEEVKKDEVSVPNVVSLDYETAEDAVKDAGLKAKVKWTDSSDVDYGYVITQSPIASTKVEKGSKVTIYVSQSQQYDPEKTLYVCANEYVNLREKPSRSAKSLAKLIYNEPVVFLGTSGEYTYVSYNGTKGYILAGFLADHKDAKPNYDDGNIKEEPKSQPNQVKSVYYCCATEFVTLRKSASIESTPLDRIGPREAVEYLGSSGNFYYVEYQDQKGYVLKKFFSTDPNAPLVDDPV